MVDDCDLAYVAERSAARVAPTASLARLARTAKQGNKLMQKLDKPSVEANLATQMNQNIFTEEDNLLTSFLLAKIRDDERATIPECFFLHEKVRSMAREVTRKNFAQFL